MSFSLCEEVLTCGNGPGQALIPRAWEGKWVINKGEDRQTTTKHAACTNLEAQMRSLGDMIPKALSSNDYIMTCYCLAMYYRMRFPVKYFMLLLNTSYLLYYLIFLKFKCYMPN